MKNKSQPQVAVYFCNGIGNLLELTPAIQALSKLFDNTTIDIVWPSEWNDYRASTVREILDSWDLINRVISFPAEEFHPEKYKLLFSTGHGEPSQAASLFLQKGNKFEPASWMSEYPHEIEYYMNEVYRLGYRGNIPQIVIPRANKPIFRGKKQRIAIYNGAAQLSEKYRWERKKWKKFAKLVKVVYNYNKGNIVYLGGSSEKEEGERLEKQFGFVKNYAGKLSFLESVKALSQCDLLISSDSALMHAAEAVNVPVVALFGATLVSKNRPYFGKYEIVRGKCIFAPCQYTSRFSTCKNYACMDSITVGDVMRAIRKTGVLKGGVNAKII